jgi:hypothetical protein
MFPFLCVLSSAELPGLSVLIIGEWTGAISRNGLHIPDPVSRFTVEFHQKPEIRVTEGSLWRDDLNSTEILPIDAFRLFHFEILWSSEIAGEVFSVGPERSRLTRFEFQGTMSGAAMFAKMSFGREWWLDLTLYNGSYFRAVMSKKQSSGVAEYVIMRAMVPAVKAGGGLRKWGIIGGIVIVIQIAVFWALRRCNTSLTRQLEELKAQTVIDLDGPAQSRRKRKAE